MTTTSLTERVDSLLFESGDFIQFHASAFARELERISGWKVGPPKYRRRREVHSATLIIKHPDNASVSVELWGRHDRDVMLTVKARSLNFKIGHIDGYYAYLNRVLPKLELQK